MNKSLSNYSLFVYLLIIFSILGIAIISTFIISFHKLATNPYQHFFKVNSKQYLSYIIDNFQHQPDLNALAELSNKVDITFYFRLNGTIYSTLADTNHNELEELLHEASKIKAPVAEERVEHSVIVKREHNLFIFIPKQWKDDHFPVLPLTVASIISILLLFIAYLSIRKLFRPLESIKEGADHYAQGDFDYQIVTGAKGQLKELTESIQHMRLRIKQMIQAKEELLLAIAHELRTPLTRAKVHLEFIEDEEVKQHLNTEIKEMSELVTNLLESERMKEGLLALNLESFSVSEYLRETIQTRYIEEDLKLELEGDIHLKIDKARFDIVISNLLNNALKYGENQPVTIRLNNTSLSIEDRGKGMQASEIPRITTAFYRINKGRERSSGGVGLGLYLVKKIVEAHGFSLRIQSNPGEGSTFQIRFTSDSSD